MSKERQNDCCGMNKEVGGGRGNEKKPNLVMTKCSLVERQTSSSVCSAHLNRKRWLRPAVPVQLSLSYPFPALSS